MADALTIQGMIDANADVDTIEKAALEDMIVTARNGRQFPSAPRAVRLILEQGTIDAFLFLTKADLDIGKALGSDTPITLVDDDFGLVFNDEILNNNGYYQMQSGTLVYLKYNPVLAAKAYTDSIKADTLSKVQNSFDTKAQMVASPLLDGSKAFVGSDTVAANNGFYKKVAGVWVNTLYSIQSELQKFGVLSNHNVLEGYTLRTNIYVDKNGSEVSASNVWATTPLLSTTGIINLTYKATVTNAVCVISLYDTNGVFVRTLLNGAGATEMNGTIDMPKDTPFFKLSFRIDLPYSFTALGYQKPITPVTKPISRYQNDKWLSFGTSIADSNATSYTYQKWVKEHFNFALYNHALSGSRLRKSLIAKSPDLLDTHILDSDLVTIDHGTNDFKLETVVGAITDTPTSAALLKDTAYQGSSAGTFYGDLRGVIEYIYSVDAAARIMLMTPIRRTAPAATGTDTNAAGFKLVDYSNAVKAVAAFYGLPVLDNHDTSGFNAITLASYSTDGLHPTAWAQEHVLSNKIIGFIESN